MTQAWWQGSVIYEILIASFQDSTGDGWGDLPGITSRLGYLSDLGVDAIWLSPFYLSPLYDLGYDVSDHTAIHPRFGTMDDFDLLLTSAHRCGLKVVIDYVPNHTSRQHAWFEQSCTSLTNPKRDWYLWHAPQSDGTPPNNWLNRFGRSAWTMDANTNQYYFATFAPEQPDLNWRNPEVRQAMFDILRFWLDRGTDGVRVDALAHLIKDQAFRNNPPNVDYTDDQEPSNRLTQPYSQNHPDLLEVLGQLRAVIDEYPNRLLMGEAYQSAEQIAAYQRAGVHVLLDTSMLQVPFKANQLRNVIDRTEALTPHREIPSRSAGNHDIARLAKRVGQVNLYLAALLQLTVRGVASIYYGDELGLNPLLVSPDRMQDPSGRDDPRYSRDHSRAPMPWDDSPQGGFSTREPWLPTDQATLQRNVADQLTDPNSLLRFYHRILALRSKEPELQDGDYYPIDWCEPVLAFYRGDPHNGLLVALNLSDEPATVEISELQGRVLLSTNRVNASRAIESQFELQPREGIVARISRTTATHSVSDIAGESQ